MKIIQHCIKYSLLTVHLYFFVVFIGVLTTSRFLLAMWQSERVTDVNGWFPLLAQGLRIDIATLSILLVFPILISFFIPNQRALYGAKIFRFWNQLVQIWLSLIAFVLVFMELSTPSFIIEYNIRPNRLFVEYLIYPKEVFSMLMKSHPWELILTSVICSLVAIYTWKKVAKINQQVQPLKWQLRPAIFIISFLILAIGGRSTLGHRPINPAMVYFSSDPLVNSLILNSLYSVGHAMDQMFSEESSQSNYGSLSNSRVIELVKQASHSNFNSLESSITPILISRKASHIGSRKNLVIILEESLGARFVGSLGGLDLTPNIDKLSQDSWFFRSMLATGTRSVRGIEAVITGFTPTPDRAVVKLGKSQRDFFTIAELLKREGYHTEFIYGGEAHFDNMKSFFLGNGFDKITEQKDYIEPKFVGSWGVSDEDLLSKAHQQFSQLHSQNKPFFSLVFSSSNHSPFEYPDGRIIPFDIEKNTRNNAIQYADWALGSFFEKAKQSNYWDDTLFLVIADHDANALGTGLVPLKSFHIPAMIIGKGIESRQDLRVVSQLDMPVTMLSLIGVDSVTPMIGRDLSDPLTNNTSLAYMQYGQNFGLLEGDKVTILQPEKAPLSYSFELDNFNMSLVGESSKNDSEKALAISLWGKLAYWNKYYQLPKDDTPRSKVEHVGIKKSSQQ